MRPFYGVLFFWIRPPRSPRPVRSMPGAVPSTPTSEAHPVTGDQWDPWWRPPWCQPGIRVEPWEYYHPRPDLVKEGLENQADPLQAALESKWFQEDLKNKRRRQQYAAEKAKCDELQRQCRKRRTAGSEYLDKLMEVLEALD